MRVCSNFVDLHADIQLSQHRLLKETFSPLHVLTSIAIYVKYRGPHGSSQGPLQKQAVLSNVVTSSSTHSARPCLTLPPSSCSLILFPGTTVHMNCCRSIHDPGSVLGRSKLRQTCGQEKNKTATKGERYCAGRGGRGEAEGRAEGAKKKL